MSHDEVLIREFARSYTDAWCSHDPAKVADHFVTGVTIAIKGRIRPPARTRRA